LLWVWAIRNRQPVQFALARHAGYFSCHHAFLGWRNCFPAKSRMTALLRVGVMDIGIRNLLCIRFGGHSRILPRTRRRIILCRIARSDYATALLLRWFLDLRYAHRDRRNTLPSDSWRIANPTVWSRSSCGCVRFLALRKSVGDHQQSFQLQADRLSCNLQCLRTPRTARLSCSTSNCT
jgi:hypothetical protein